jgi:hypothetical protein
MLTAVMPSDISSFIFAPCMLLHLLYSKQTHALLLKTHIHILKHYHHHHHHHVKEGLGVFPVPCSSK